MSGAVDAGGLDVVEEARDTAWGQTDTLRKAGQGRNDEHAPITGLDAIALRCFKELVNEFYECCKRGT